MSAASSANLPKTTSMNRAASHNLATPQLSQAHHFFLTIPATTATTCLKQVCKQVQGSVTLQRIMSAPMAYFRSHSWCWNSEKEVTSILWWVDHFTRRLTMQSWQPSTFKFRSVNFWGGIQPVVGSLPGPQTKKAFRLFGEQQPGPPFLRYLSWKGLHCDQPFCNCTESGLQPSDEAQAEHSHLF